MTTIEILNVIHKKGVEAEIYRVLSDWILNDRQQQIVEVARYKAIVRTVKKIASDNANKNDAIEGIINLCSE